MIAKRRELMRLLEKMVAFYDYHAIIKLNVEGNELIAFVKQNLRDVLENEFHDYENISFLAISTIINSQIVDCFKVECLLSS
jgi:hypothetical protein